MSKHKEVKSLRFLVLGILCLTILLFPVVFYWLKNPSVKSWAFAGIIALVFAGIAEIKRFIEDNRKY